MQCNAFFGIYPEICLKLLCFVFNACLIFKKKSLETTAYSTYGFCCVSMVALNNAVILLVLLSGFTILQLLSLTRIFLQLHFVRVCLYLAFGIARMPGG